MASQAIAIPMRGPSDLGPARHLELTIGQRALDAMGGTDRNAAHRGADQRGKVAPLTLSIYWAWFSRFDLLLDKDRVHAGAMRAASFIPGEDLRRRVLHACSITTTASRASSAGKCIRRSS